MLILLLLLPLLPCSAAAPTHRHIGLLVARRSRARRPPCCTAAQLAMGNSSVDDSEEVEGALVGLGMGFWALLSWKASLIMPRSAWRVS